MKEFTESEIKKILKLLLNTADYWIGKISSLNIDTKEWIDFKKNMKPFLSIPCILPTGQSEDHPDFCIGLANYHNIGPHIVIGPRIDKLNTLSVISIKFGERYFWGDYMIKSEKIQILIHDRQRQEMKYKFLQATDNVAESIESILFKDSVLRGWMIELYKKSWSTILENPLGDAPDGIYRYLDKDNPKIPCTGSDQYIQLLQNPNSPGYYSLRFGTMQVGQDYIEVPLGYHDDLKKYSDECIATFSTYLEDTVQKTLFKLLG